MGVKRTGRIFGWFMIATFVTSIPARLLFVDGVGASWDHMRFVPGAGDATSLRVGATLEFALIIFNIATAVVIYPLVRRQSETLSLGYVAARIMDRNHRDRPDEHHLGRERDRDVGSRWRDAGDCVDRGGPIVGAHLRMGLPVRSRARRRLR